MSNNNYFSKNSFTLENFFTGLLKDNLDSRDYKFSDLMKKQGILKTIKKKIKVLDNPPRGRYRKFNYGKILKTIVIREDIVTKKLLKNYSLQIDHSNITSSVKNQGRLGSCVAFAGAALKEIQERREHEEERASGKKYDRSKQYDYSEQWLYWNCKKIDGIPDQEGTYVRTVMKVLNKIGVPTENAWPYSDSSIDIGKPKSWANLVARWATIGSYWSIANLTELKAALAESPVLIGVPVFMEWAKPPNGIINYPADPNRIYGGHCVCVIGYSDHTQLIKFKNSWGKYWGDGGYGYLPYRYINDFLWSAWVARDISVTKDMLKGTVSL